MAINFETYESGQDRFLVGQLQVLLNPAASEEEKQKANRFLLIAMGKRGPETVLAEFAERVFPSEARSPTLPPPGSDPGREVGAAAGSAAAGEAPAADPRTAVIREWAEKNSAKIMAINFETCESGQDRFLVGQLQVLLNPAASKENKQEADRFSLAAMRERDPATVLEEFAKRVFPPEARPPASLSPGSEPARGGGPAARPRANAVLEDEVLSDLAAPSAAVAGTASPPPILGPEKLYGWHSSTLTPLEKEAVFQAFLWMKDHHSDIMCSLAKEHILVRLMPLAEHNALDDAQVRELLDFSGFRKAVFLDNGKINDEGLSTFLDSLLPPTAAPAATPLPRTAEKELRKSLDAWIARHKTTLEKAPGRLPPLEELLRKAAQAYPATTSEEYRKALDAIVGNKLVLAASALRTGHLNEDRLTTLLSESYGIISRAGTSSVVPPARQAPRFVPPSASTFSPSAAMAAAPARGAGEIAEEVKERLQRDISAWAKGNVRSLINSTTGIGRTLYQLSHDPLADIEWIMEALKDRMDLSTSSYDGGNLDRSLWLMAGLPPPSGMIAAAPPPVETPSPDESLSGRAASPPQTAGAPSLVPTGGSLPPVAPASTGAPAAKTAEKELRTHLGEWIAHHKATLEKAPGPLPPLEELLRKAAQTYPDTESEGYKKALDEIVGNKLVLTASALHSGRLNEAKLKRLLSESYEIMRQAGRSSVASPARGALHTEDGPRPAQGLERRAPQTVAPSLAPIGEGLPPLEQARKDATAWIEALKSDPLRCKGEKARAIFLDPWISWPDKVLEDLFAKSELLSMTGLNVGEYDKEELEDYLDKLIEEPPAPGSSTMSPAEKERNVLSGYLYDKLLDVNGVVKHMQKSTQPLCKLLEKAIVDPKEREALLNELLKNDAVKGALAARHPGNELNTVFDTLFPLTEEQAKTILGEWILDHAPAHRTMSDSTVLDLIKSALRIDRQHKPGTDAWARAVNSIWVEVRKDPYFEKGVSVGALTRYLKRLTPGT